MRDHGRSHGIGRATALAAAAEGAALCLTDRNAALLDELCAELSRSGAVVLASRALDIADFEAVRSFAESIHAEHGSVDVVMTSLWSANTRCWLPPSRRCVSPGTSSALPCARAGA